MPWPRPRVLLTAVLLAGIALTPLATSAGSAVGSSEGRQTSERKARGTLVVIGDSIVRTFNDKPGSPKQGFWSMTAREVGARPKIFAQGGAGFVKPGLPRCKGRNFIQQLARPEVRRAVENADALIIEGGRNDGRTCRGQGFADVSSRELRAAVDEFLDEVQVLRGGDDCTMVMTPWGPKGKDERARITPLVRRVTRAHGYDFVDTVGLLDREHAAPDGVHPNHAGNVALTKALLRQTFVRACFYR